MVTLEPNRLSRAIEDIRVKCDALDEAKRANLDAEMAVTFEEHFAFQQAQARAHAGGKITTAEAQIVYVALGEVGSSKNGGWASGTDLATKVAITLAMGELLGR